MASGYSGTPLPTKLGIKAGGRVLLDGAPADFDLGPLSADIHRRRGSSPYDVGLLFVASTKRLVERWQQMHTAVTPAGRLWVAWPKKSSGVVTDLDENVVREHGLTHGRVDVKVCGIDQTWSGLCFVVRISDRQQVAGAGSVSEIR